MRPCLWNNVQAGSLPGLPFPQGPYAITDCDYIDIGAMDASTDNLIQTQTGLLHTDGTVSVTFSSPIASSTSYFIRIRHRNALETWSALPVDFSSTTSIAPYDFTSAVTRAYSYDYSVLPMHQMNDGKWALLSGDMGSLPGVGVQDGNIDLYDFNFWDSDNAIFNFGYLVGDLNGDVNVDLYDFNFWDINNAFFAFTQHP
jgi:hypothetical protein